MTDRARAEALDAEDELSQFPERFVQPPGDVIYLDGNSLGLLPTQTRDRLRRFIDDEWGDEGVRGWQHWVDLPTSVGDSIGKLIGAAPGQVVVCDTISTNLFKLASAVLDAMPGRKVIVTDSGNFPSDRYVLGGVAERKKGQLRLVPTDPLLGVTPDALHTYLADDVALVSFSHVDYRSSAIADVAALTAQAHAAGALVLWELAHSVGSVPLDLDGLGADLAVGCTYKYLNAGPGAPAFLYVRRDLQDKLQNPIRGWWSDADMFDMDSPYEPAKGIMRFLTGSPSVIGTIGAQESVRMLLDADVTRIRSKSTRMTEYLIEMADQWLAPLGFSVASPRDPNMRGGHVVLAHDDAFRVGEACVKAGVIVDVRPPNLLRLCPTPLTNTYVDVWEAMTRIRDVVGSQAHLALPTTRARVT